MSKLNHSDLQWCLRRAPRRVLEALKHFGPKLCVGGGYVRACIANEEVNDIDLFVDSKDTAKAVVAFLRKKGPNDKEDRRVHESDNALTVKGYRYPVQIIHRWTFATPQDVVPSFDFTVARAVFWWDNQVAAMARWLSLCDPRFYEDLCAKRLRYCCPQRNEDAGGSMLRVLKFYQKGYRIPIDSLGAVIARLAVAYELPHEARSTGYMSEEHLAKVLTGLLREVDPNIDPSHIAHLPAENVQDDTTPTED